MFEQALRLPETEALKKEMNRFRPLGCLMTGSGSSVFALFDRRAEAEPCAEALRRMESLPGGLLPFSFAVLPGRSCRPAQDPSLE